MEGRPRGGLYCVCVCERGARIRVLATYGQNNILLILTGTYKRVRVLTNHKAEFTAQQEVHQENNEHCISNGYHHLS